jgi:hypothetical protein
MASTNPSVVRYGAVAQDLSTIGYPVVSAKQYSIQGVSKADPAVVTVATATTISATGTVGTIAGTGPYTATITNMTTTQGILVGQKITCTAGTGSIGNGVVHVTSIIGNTIITIVTEGGSTPTAGTITDITIPVPSSLPVGMVDGEAIVITGVAGMTELATAGEDGSNKFYVTITGPATFELQGVDSTGFTTATANTGSFQLFDVPEYETAGTTVNVLFNQSSLVEGTDIAVEENTGVITLAADLTYSLYASANVNVAGATYQWYDLTNDAALDVAMPVGVAITTMVTPSVETDYCLRIISAAGTEFVYPAQITNGQLVVEVVSGFIA